MGVVGEQQLAPRMRAEGLRRVLEARAVDRRMASLAAIHARDRLVEVVAVEFVEYDLLDIRNLIDWNRTGVNERCVVHDAAPLIALGGQLGLLVLKILA